MNMDKEEKSKYKYGSSKKFKTILNRNDFKVFNKQFSHTTRKNEMIPLDTALCLIAKTHGYLNFWHSI